MELSVVYSRALTGIDGTPGAGGDAFVQRAAGLSHCGPAGNRGARKQGPRPQRHSELPLHFPDRRITVNLAPADLPKEGGRFDLPIALGILSASGQVPGDTLAQHEFLGELALDGSLRPVPGVVAAASAAQRAGAQLVVATEAPRWQPRSRQQRYSPHPTFSHCAPTSTAARDCCCPPQPRRAAPPYPDLRDVVGQEGARRALEIAASGGHNLLLAAHRAPEKPCWPADCPAYCPHRAAEALTGWHLRDV